MRRTPPAPDILRHTHATLTYALQKVKGPYKEQVPDFRAAVRKDIELLRPEAKLVLPQALSSLPVLADGNDAVGEELAQMLEESMTAVRMALLVVDHPQQEKINLTEEESLTAEHMRDTPAECVGITAGLWDMDLQRLDELTNEHRWLPEDWKSFGGEFRRTVARKERDIVAMTMFEMQRERNQAVLFNAAFHPQFPETMEQVLEHTLGQTAECPRTVMAVREGRRWLYKLLIKKGFMPAGTLRNHFRFQDDFEDAYIFERT